MPSRRKLFKSNNILSKLGKVGKIVEAKKPASWALDVSLPPIDLSPHRPSTPPAWMKTSPHKYSFDQPSSSDDDTDSEPESKSLLAIGNASEPESQFLLAIGNDSELESQSLLAIGKRMYMVHEYKNEKEENAKEIDKHF